MMDQEDNNIFKHTSCINIYLLHTYILKDSQKIKYNIDIL